MKKLLLVILSVMVVSSAFAREFDSKGVISGWKFAPAQVGVGIFESANLFDADSVALFSIGLLGIQQYSSIVSVGGITELKNNYGIQVSAASLADRNYGLMIGLENCAGVDENYGLKVGLFNAAGKKGENTNFQIGLLNYNENALIKWMPFFNFGFEKEEK